MLSINHENPPEMDDEGSVFGEELLFSPTPEGFTEMQSRFVDAFVQLGGKGEKAAIAAGYSPVSAKTMAVRCLATPKIVGLIGERLKLQGPTLLAVAIGGLVKVIEKGTDEKAIVLAANSLCDRFGLAAPKGPLVQFNQTNVNGDVVQNILAEVSASRAARLREERDMTPIVAPMADIKQPAIEAPKAPQFAPPATVRSSSLFD